VATDSSSPSRGDVRLVWFGANGSGKPGKNPPAIVVSSVCERSRTDADLRGLTPLFWSNINPSGTFHLDMAHKLDLGIPVREESVAVPV
jgi:hypothetical protein